MFRNLKNTALCAAFAMLAAVPAAAAPPSPEGLWRTYDDRTGEARALVRIYREESGLFGRIEETFGPGESDKRCTPCTDSRKDQPIIGLVILRGLKEDDGEFSGGDILDPESGSVYRCLMRLEEDGARLTVRGYLGVSLFGRSQTWRRAE